MQSLVSAPDPVELPAEVHIAGLRSALVSRLTGLTPSQLQYWHRSGLLEAHLRPGRRGIPRLYSWVDYLRLQVAGQLTTHVPTLRIRRAIDFLDAVIPTWYLLPIFAEAGDIAARLPGLAPMLVMRGGQFELDWPVDLSSVGSAVEAVLRRIAARGPLGELGAFSDAVTMAPLVNLGQPTLRGTVLETRFVAGIARDIGPAQTAALYRIDRADIDRAIEFERVVAA